MQNNGDHVDPGKIELSVIPERLRGHVDSYRITKILVFFVKFFSKLKLYFLRHESLLRQQKRTQILQIWI